MSDKGGSGGWVVRPGQPARGASQITSQISSVPPPSSGSSPGMPSSAIVPAAPARVVKALQNAYLFRNFTETGIGILATVAQEKTIPAGTPLFVENMIGEALYVIADGRIRIGVRGPDGQEQPLTLLETGDSLGEAALLRSGPRLCSATAETAAIVLEISRRDVAQLQKSKPQACLKLMMAVVELLGQRMKDADPDLRTFVAWRAGYHG